MAKYSTGLRTRMLGSEGFKSIMDGCFMNIYSGVEPATADAAPTGDLLAKITDNGGAGGLTFATPGGALVTKTEAQVWKTDSILFTGVAGYFRLALGSDDDSVSILIPRVQGRIAIAGADLNFVDVAFVELAQKRVNYFAVAFNTL